MVKFEVTGDERLTRTFPGRAHRRGADRVVNNSSTGAHASELPSQSSVVRPSVETTESKSDAAARGEHGKHTDHERWHLWKTGFC